MTPAAKKAVAKKTTAKKTAAKKTAAAPQLNELAQRVMDTVKQNVASGTTRRTTGNRFLRDLGLPELPEIQSCTISYINISLPEGQTMTRAEWATAIFNALSTVGTVSSRISIRDGLTITNA